MLETNKRFIEIKHKAVKQLEDLVWQAVMYGIEDWH